MATILENISLNGGGRHDSAPNLSLWVAQAEEFLDASVWYSTERYNLGVALLVLHWLVLEDLLAAAHGTGVGGLSPATVTMRKERSVEMQYSDIVSAIGSIAENDLRYTTYGSRFIQVRNATIVTIGINLT